MTGSSTPILTSDWLQTESLNPCRNQSLTIKESRYSPCPRFAETDLYHLVCISSLPGLLTCPVISTYLFVEMIRLNWVEQPAPLQVDVQPKCWTCSFARTHKACSRAVVVIKEMVCWWYSNMSGNHYKGNEVSCCIKYFIFGFNILFWVSWPIYFPLSIRLSISFRWSLSISVAIR